MTEQSTEKLLDRYFWIVLGVALLLRVGVVLVYFTGVEISSDQQFYIEVAQTPDRLWIGYEKEYDADTGYGRWHVTSNYPVTTIGPVYPFGLSPIFHLLPAAELNIQVQIVRMGQATLDTLTAALIYLIAFMLFKRTAARVALIAQALDVRYMFQSGLILTETLFIFLLVLFVLFYLQGYQKLKPVRYQWAGVVLGVAALTRPIPLLFPVPLLLHALFHPENRRKALVSTIGLLVAMGLTITPWIVRTWLITGEIVPITRTASTHIWLASREDGQELGAADYDERFEEVGGYKGAEGDVDQDAYVEAALENITSTPLNWVKRIVVDTLKAYLQPYGTVILKPGGASVKQAVLDLFTGQISLREVLAIPTTGRRFLMYIWHYWSVFGGALGTALLLKEKNMAAWVLPLWIAYGTAVTAVLLIEPRYLFPAMFAFTVLAAYASVWMWQWHKGRRAQSA